MKTNFTILILIIAIFANSCGNNNAESKHSMHIAKDKRISLNLKPKQKRHQLQNMRSHLEAIQQITQYLASNEYKKASKIAEIELGSTTEMKLMCASFGNKDFENMGINFHKSADLMSQVLLSKNKEKSLNALSNTLNYCVGCHAKFKQ